uniref:Uncharacterized protein n=1 Tax=Neospora caninum (strain Liverpool) TaxID=572307 RepID=A0A0F7UFM3_NEOCL|nr:TPA: hypothetical protein BN1204_035790 [Neospora caninum Liverpool]
MDSRCPPVAEAQEGRGTTCSRVSTVASLHPISCTQRYSVRSTDSSEEEKFSRGTDFSTFPFAAATLGSLSSWSATAVSSSTPSLSSSFEGKLQVKAPTFSVSLLSPDAPRSGYKTSLLSRESPGSVSTHSYRRGIRSEGSSRDGKIGKHWSTVDRAPMCPLTPSPWASSPRMPASFPSVRSGQNSVGQQQTLGYRPLRLPGVSTCLQQDAVTVSPRDSAPSPHFSPHRLSYGSSRSSISYAAPVRSVDYPPQHSPFLAGEELVSHPEVMSRYNCGNVHIPTEQQMGSAVQRITLPGPEIASSVPNGTHTRDGNILDWEPGCCPGGTPLSRSRPEMMPFPCSTSGNETTSEGNTRIHSTGEISGLGLRLSVAASSCRQQDSSTEAHPEHGVRRFVTEGKTSDTQRDFAHIATPEVQRSSPSPAALTGPVFGEPSRLSVPGTVSCSLPRERGEDHNNILRSQIQMDVALSCGTAKNEAPVNSLLRHTMMSSNRLFSRVSSERASDMQHVPTTSMDCWPSPGLSMENAFSPLTLTPRPPPLRRGFELQSSSAAGVDAQTCTSAQFGLCQSPKRLPLTLEKEIESQSLVNWACVESGLPREVGYFASKPVSGSRDLHKGPTGGMASQNIAIPERDVPRPTVVNLSLARTSASLLELTGASVPGEAGQANNGTSFTQADAPFCVFPTPNEKRSAEGHLRVGSTANAPASHTVPSLSRRCLHDELPLSDRVREEPVSVPPLGSSFTGRHPRGSVSLGTFADSYRHQKRDELGSPGPRAPCDGILQSAVSSRLASASGTADVFRSTPLFAVRRSEMDDILDGCYDSEDDNKLRRLLAPMPDSPFQKELSEMQFDFQQERQWKQCVALAIGAETAEHARYQGRTHVSNPKSISDAEPTRPRHERTLVSVKRPRVQPKRLQGDRHHSGNRLCVSESAFHERAGTDNIKGHGHPDMATDDLGAVCGHSLSGVAHDSKSEDGVCTLEIETGRTQCLEILVRKVKGDTGDEGCLGSTISVREPLREVHHRASCKHNVATPKESRPCKTFETNSEFRTHRRCLVDVSNTEEMEQPSNDTSGSMQPRGVRRTFERFGDGKCPDVPLDVSIGEGEKSTGLIPVAIDGRVHGNHTADKHEVVAQLIHRNNAASAGSPGKNMGTFTSVRSTAGHDAIQAVLEKDNGTAENIASASTVYEADGGADACWETDGRRPGSRSDTRVEKCEAIHRICDPESAEINTTLHSPSPASAHSVDHARSRHSTDRCRWHDANYRSVMTTGGEQPAEASRGEGSRTPAESQWVIGDEDREETAITAQLTVRTTSSENARCTRSGEDECSLHADEGESELSADARPLPEQDEESSAEVKTEKPAQQRGGKHPALDKQSARPSGPDSDAQQTTASFSHTENCVELEPEAGTKNAIVTPLQQQRDDAGPREETVQGRTDTGNTADAARRPALSGSTAEKRADGVPAASAERNLDVPSVPRHPASTGSPHGRMGPTRASRRARRGRGGRARRESSPSLAAAKEGRAVQPTQPTGEPAFTRWRGLTVSCRGDEGCRALCGEQAPEQSPAHPTPLAFRCRASSPGSVHPGVHETEANSRSKGSTAWRAERERRQETFLRASVVDDDTWTAADRPTDAGLKTTCVGEVVHLSVFERTASCTKNRDVNATEGEETQVRPYSSAGFEPQETPFPASEHQGCGTLPESAKENSLASDSSVEETETGRTEATSVVTQLTARPQIPPEPAATGVSRLAASGSAYGNSGGRKKTCLEALEEQKAGTLPQGSEDPDLWIQAGHTGPTEDPPPLSPTDHLRGVAARQCQEPIEVGSFVDGDTETEPALPGAVPLRTAPKHPEGEAERIASQASATIRKNLRPLDGTSLKDDTVSENRGGGDRAFGATFTEKKGDSDETREHRIVTELGKKGQKEEARNCNEPNSISRQAACRREKRLLEVHTSQSSGGKARKQPASEKGGQGDCGEGERLKRNAREALQGATPLEARPTAGGTVGGHPEGEKRATTSEAEHDEYEGASKKAVCSSTGTQSSEETATGQKGESNCKTRQSSPQPRPTMHEVFVADCVFDKFHLDRVENDTGEDGEDSGGEARLRETDGDKGEPMDAENSDSCLRAEDCMHPATNLLSSAVQAFWLGIAREVRPRRSLESHPRKWGLRTLHRNAYLSSIISSSLSKLKKSVQTLIAVLLLSPVPLSFLSLFSLHYRTGSSHASPAFFSLPPRFLTPRVSSLHPIAVSTLSTLPSVSSLCSRFMLSLAVSRSTHFLRFLLASFSATRFYLCYLLFRGVSFFLVALSLGPWWLVPGFSLILRPRSPFVVPFQVAPHAIPPSLLPLCLRLPSAYLSFSSSASKKYRGRATNALPFSLVDQKKKLSRRLSRISFRSLLPVPAHLKEYPPAELHLAPCVRGSLASRFASKDRAAKCTARDQGYHLPSSDSSSASSSVSFPTSTSSLFSNASSPVVLPSSSRPFTTTAGHSHRPSAQTAESAALLASPGRPLEIENKGTVQPPALHSESETLHGEGRTEREIRIREGDRMAGHESGRKDRGTKGKSEGENGEDGPQTHGQGSLEVRDAPARFDLDTQTEKEAACAGRGQRGDGERGTDREKENKEKPGATDQDQQREDEVGDERRRRRGEREDHVRPRAAHQGEERDSSGDRKRLHWSSPVAGTDLENLPGKPSELSSCSTEALHLSSLVGTCEHEAQSENEESRKPGSTHSFASLVPFASSRFPSSPPRALPASDAARACAESPLSSRRASSCLSSSSRSAASSSSFMSFAPLDLSGASPALPSSGQSPRATAVPSGSPAALGEAAADLALIPGDHSPRPATRGSGDSWRLCSSAPHCAENRNSLQTGLSRETATTKMDTKEETTQLVCPSSSCQETHDQGDANFAEPERTERDLQKQASQPSPLADFLRLSTADCGVHCFSYYLRGGVSASLPLMLGVRERLWCADACVSPVYKPPAAAAAAPPQTGGREAPATDCRGEAALGLNGDSCVPSPETGADPDLLGGDHHRVLEPSRGGFDEPSRTRERSAQRDAGPADGSRTQSSSPSQPAAFSSLRTVPPCLPLGGPPSQIKHEDDSEPGAKTAGVRPPERGKADCGLVRFAPFQKEQTEGRFCSPPPCALAPAQFECIQADHPTIGYEGERKRPVEGAHSERADAPAQRLRAPEQVRCLVGDTEHASDPMAPADVKTGGDDGHASGHFSPSRNGASSVVSSGAPASSVAQPLPSSASFSTSAIASSATCPLPPYFPPASSSDTSPLLNYVSPIAPASTRLPPSHTSFLPPSSPFSLRPPTPSAVHSSSVPPPPVYPSSFLPASSAPHSSCCSSTSSGSSLSRASSSQLPSREAALAERLGSVAGTRRLFDLATTHSQAGRAHAKKPSLGKRARGCVDRARCLEDRKLRHEEMKRQERRRRRQKRERSTSAFRCHTYLGDELRRNCRALLRRRLIDEFFARIERERERAFSRFAIASGIAQNRRVDREKARSPSIRNGRNGVSCPSRSCSTRHSACRASLSTSWSQTASEPQSCGASSPSPPTQTNLRKSTAQKNEESVVLCTCHEEEDGTPPLRAETDPAFVSRQRRADADKKWAADVAETESDSERRAAGRSWGSGGERRMNAPAERENLEQMLTGKRPQAQPEAAARSAEKATVGQERRDRCPQGFTKNRAAHGVSAPPRIRLCDYWLSFDWSLAPTTLGKGDDKETKRATAQVRETSPGVRREKRQRDEESGLRARLVKCKRRVPIGASERSEDDGSTKGDQGDSSGEEPDTEAKDRGPEEEFQGEERRDGKRSAYCVAVRQKVGALGWSRKTVEADEGEKDRRETEARLDFEEAGKTEEGEQHTRRETHHTDLDTCPQRGDGEVDRPPAGERNLGEAHTLCSREKTELSVQRQGDNGEGGETEEKKEEGKETKKRRGASPENPRALLSMATPRPPPERRMAASQQGGQGDTDWEAVESEREETECENRDKEGGWETEGRQIKTAEGRGQHGTEGQAPKPSEEEQCIRRVTLLEEAGRGRTADRGEERDPDQEENTAPPQTRLRSADESVLTSPKDRAKRRKLGPNFIEGRKNEKERLGDGHGRFGLDRTQGEGGVCVSRRDRDQLECEEAERKKRGDSPRLLEKEEETRIEIPTWDRTEALARPGEDPAVGNVSSGSRAALKTEESVEMNIEAGELERGFDTKAEEGMPLPSRSQRGSENGFLPTAACSRDSLPFSHMASSALDCFFSFFSLAPDIGCLSGSPEEGAGRRRDKAAGFSDARGTGLRRPSWCSALQSASSSSLPSSLSLPCCSGSAPLPEETMPASLSHKEEDALEAREERRQQGEAHRAAIPERGGRRSDTGKRELTESLRSGEDEASTEEGGRPGREEGERKNRDRESKTDPWGTTEGHASERRSREGFTSSGQGSEGWTEGSWKAAAEGCEMRQEGRTHNGDERARETRQDQEGKGRRRIVCASGSSDEARHTERDVGTSLVDSAIRQSLLWGVLFASGFEERRAAEEKKRFTAARFAGPEGALVRLDRRCPRLVSFAYKAAETRRRRVRNLLDRGVQVLEREMDHLYDATSPRVRDSEAEKETTREAEKRVNRNQKEGEEGNEHRERADAEDRGVSTERNIEEHEQPESEAGEGTRAQDASLPGGQARNGESPVEMPSAFCAVESRFPACSSLSSPLPDGIATGTRAVPHAGQAQRVGVLSDVKASFTLSPASVPLSALASSTPTCAAVTSTTLALASSPAGAAVPSSAANGISTPGVQTEEKEEMERRRETALQEENAQTEESDGKLRDAFPPHAKCDAKHTIAADAERPKRNIWPHCPAPGGRPLEASLSNESGNPVAPISSGPEQSSPFFCVPALRPAPGETKIKSPLDATSAARLSHPAGNLLCSSPPPFGSFAPPPNFVSPPRALEQPTCGASSSDPRLESPQGVPPFSGRKPVSPQTACSSPSWTPAASLSSASVSCRALCARSLASAFPAEICARFENGLHPPRASDVPREGTGTECEPESRRHRGFLQLEEGDDRREQDGEEGAKGERSARGGRHAGRLREQRPEDSNGCGIGDGDTCGEGGAENHKQQETQDDGGDEQRTRQIGEFEEGTARFLPAFEASESRHTPSESSGQAVSTGSTVTGRQRCGSEEENEDNTLGVGTADATRLTHVLPSRRGDSRASGPLPLCSADAERSSVRLESVSSARPAPSFPALPSSTSSVCSSGTLQLIHGVSEGGGKSEGTRDLGEVFASQAAPEQSISPLPVGHVTLQTNFQPSSLGLSAMEGCASVNATWPEHRGGSCVEKALFADKKTGVGQDRVESFCGQPSSPLPDVACCGENTFPRDEEKETAVEDLAPWAPVSAPTANPVAIASSRRIPL